MNGDMLTENVIDTVFRMVDKPIQSYERPDSSVQMDVTIERNLSLVKISRDGYTFLDWISDIGGIQGILISTIAIFMGIWNYNSLDNFLSTKLYQIKAQSSTENLRFSALTGMKDYLCDLLPSCF